MDISYETAKKLKDAGFPQNITDPLSYYDAKGRRFGWSEGEDEPGQMEWTKIPTLSELIKECGEGIGGLQHYVAKRQWRAEGLDIRISNQFVSTPEEAVANLWFALNSTST